MGININSPILPFAVCAIALIIFLVFSARSKTGKGKLILPLAGVAVIIIMAAAIWFHIDYHRFNRFSWEQPNIVLIDIDTLRADHVGAYGFDLAKTPAFDSLAQQGWLFENAYSHIPITMPSHSGLFTSKLPSEAKVFNNRDDLPDGDTTLAEVLKENGYDTAGFISLGVLKSNFKINRGFDTYDDTLPKNGQWFNTADVITDRGIQWLKGRNAEKPFFLWLHYSDPHEPYCVPAKSSDTEIYLNGEKVAQGSLDSAARINAKLKLKPGLNEIELKKVGDEAITSRYISQMHFTDIENDDLPQEWQTQLKESKTKRKLYRDLQNEIFMNGFREFSLAGMTIYEGPGWHTPDRGSRLSRRSIHTNAIIRIRNNGKKEINYTLSIKGGVYKELAAVKHDYAEEVEFSDKEVGRLLAYIKSAGLDENTIIVLMADHGEELDEHGLVGHIHNLYHQSLHVPLIIRDPNAANPGLREKRRAGLVDLAPTLLDMCRIEQPDSWHGKTLMEYVNIPSAPERTHHSQTFTPEANADKFSIVKDNTYGILTPGYDRYLQLEAFDTDNDVQQHINLTLNPAFGGINNLLTSLSNYAKSIKRNESTNATDSEREEMLEDLGYIMSEDEVADKKVYQSPTEEFAAGVDQLLEILSEVGVTSHEVSIEQVNQELFYLAIRLTLAPAEIEKQLIPIQNFVQVNLVDKYSDHIFRLTISSGDALVLDKAMASK